MSTGLAWAVLIARPLGGRRPKTLVSRAILAHPRWPSCERPSSWSTRTSAPESPWYQRCGATTACCAPPPARRRIQMLQGEDVDVMLLDLHLPGIGGFDVLNITKENYPHIEVVVVSEVAGARRRNRGDAPRRVPLHGEGPRAPTPCGCWWPTPCERQNLSRSVLRLNAEVAEQHDREFIVGPSRATREVIDLVQKVAEPAGDGADPRRERHRQGAARAAAASPVGRSQRARSSP